MCRNDGNIYWHELMSPLVRAVACIFIGTFRGADTSRFGQIKTQGKGTLVNRYRELFPRG